ncbi:MAG: pyruvate, phosphate dikinase [Syntrophomonadaceae bacterium]|nr:pyruvate, phosphate dikinase [Syntrophomonadaceae bacterium]
MKKWEFSGEHSLDFLKERAKELNCLYQVDEILDNQRLSLPEIFNQIVQVIPAGWQFPEICQARIIYENSSYQTPGFSTSPRSLSSPIKVEGKVVGKIEVVYTSEVPKREEGYFLDKEQQLIRTIAQRIGQTIFARHMEQVLEEWNNYKLGINGSQGTSNEWKVIIDILRRTDQPLLMHVCRKMLDHLYWSGVKEAGEVLWNFGSSTKELLLYGELNYPIEKVPLGNIPSICERTFTIAANHLSNKEILIRLQKWIQEKRIYSLIKAVDSVDAPLREIVEAIKRYRSMTGENKVYYSPTEHWLKVALIRRFLSEKTDFIARARQHIEINDFYGIVSRLIFPEGSHGKIGGKSTGLFLAEQILKKNSQDLPELQTVQIPKTWYLTTDCLTEFLYYNNLEELNAQKYKELYQIRIDYPNVIQIMKNGEFPEGVVKSLSMALDDFGKTPLIVRSSSLLEDQLGAAFSGKYKSLFLANQGSKQQRLEALKDAIVEVYASVYGPDSIQYRAERDMLDFREEMGIMIQEVVGTRIGPYYLPLFSGVAFSHNEFRWSPRIKREDGLIRLVMGLGTRAVDRLSDDFPVLVSPGQPKLRVNTAPEEIKRYSPNKVDVINLEKNVFETIEISSLLKEYGHLIPKIDQFVSVYERDYVTKRLAFNLDFKRDDLVVTFDGLITDTPFIKKVGLILKVLKEQLGTPVDIEFACDGDHFYLLQCRPQSYGTDLSPVPIPKDIDHREIIFSANRYISNGIIPDITHLVYVDPQGYNNLQELDDLINVGKAVGLLNSLLPKKRFVLMGPGRWGSRGDIKMGVQVTYADINNTAALIEIARRKGNYIPELSFGTHFFQDLVEANIRYLPLYPDDQGIIFNERFLRSAKNILGQLLPEYSYLSEVIRVIDISEATRGKVLRVVMNADLGESLGYLAEPSAGGTINQNISLKPEKAPGSNDYHFDDRFWRWRFYMAERIAERLDLAQFGVKGIYVFGSTNNGTAGPGSDIDLLIHFQGSLEQREKLLQWLEGWSHCLSELNYLKTGYASDGLLDIHIVTDEDIANKTAFAVKIGAITDPAHPLKLQ